MTDQALDATLPAEQITEAPAVIEKAPETEKPDRLAEKPKDTRSQIQAAIKEVSERAKPKEPAGKEPKEPKPEPKVDATGRTHGADGKFTTKAEGEAREPPEAPVIPAAEKPAEAPPVAKTVDGAPPSWSQEAKAEWAKLPPAIQAAVLKREMEVSSGFKQKSDDLKRYQEIEQAVAPMRPVYQQAGLRSDAEAISRLLQWESWVRADPKSAIPALARQYGIELPSTSAQPQQGPEGENQQITAYLQSHLQPIHEQNGQLSNAFRALYSEIEQQKAARVQSDIQTFATATNADGSLKHPHFELVRTEMGRIFGSGGATDFEDAYQKAVWSNPELRAVILKEQEARAAAQQQAEAAKREAAQKAEAAKRLQAQQQANVSPRTSAPAGSPEKPKSKAKSVGESLRETLVDMRA